LPRSAGAPFEEKETLSDGVICLKGVSKCGHFGLICGSKVFSEAGGRSADVSELGGGGCRVGSCSSGAAASAAAPPPHRRRRSSAFPAAPRCAPPRAVTDAKATLQRTPPGELLAESAFEMRAPVARLQHHSGIPIPQLQGDQNTSVSHSRKAKLKQFFTASREEDFSTGFVWYRLLSSPE